MSSTFNGSITVNGAGALSLKPAIAGFIAGMRMRHRGVYYADVASIPTPLNGDVVFCVDCKNVVTNSVAVGSTYASAGAGAYIGYQEGVWRVMM